MKKLIKYMLREGLIRESSNFQVLPFYDDVDYDEFGLDLDVYEVENQAIEIAKSGGVNILSDKQLSLVMFDKKRMVVVGALWVTHDPNTFSFDIAIDSKYQNMGLATPLLDGAMDEYDYQLEVYPDLDIEVDVINPKLAQILNKKYGFEVVGHLGQNRVLMSLSEATEQYDGFEFQEDYYDYNNNQHYIRCKMFKDGELVAEAQYVKYGEEITINLIQSYVKGKGYGMTLMKHLAKLYGYENMPATNLTSDGVKMRKKLNKHFNYNPKEVNKNIPVSEIKKIPNNTIREFLLIVIKDDYSKGWEMLLKDPEYPILVERLMDELNMDFNEVTDIAEWVIDSKTNTNSPEDEPPHFIIDDLKRLQEF